MLDADSYLLTAMLTPFGIYIFNVMAMGLCNSGDLFESSLCTCISDFQVVLILLMTFSFLAGHRKSTTPMSPGF